MVYGLVFAGGVVCGLALAVIGYMIYIGCWFASLGEDD